MKKEILDFYKQFSTYTYPGCYKEFLKKLPSEVKELGNLIVHQQIHRVTLKQGNTNANKDLKYGDMNKFPELRLRAEDDLFPNAVSMIAELLRLDPKGFIKNRSVENKIVITCRHVAILNVTALKSKGIPARVRVGFAPYFFEGSWDHWVAQYWIAKQKRWITFDADGFFDFLNFDQYDIPEGKFDFAAQAWLDARSGKKPGSHFKHAGGLKGLNNLACHLFYDLHCLMNDEVTYWHVPYFVSTWNFKNLIEKDYKELDRLAKLMLNPDENFEQIKKLWDTKKKYRQMVGGLISPSDYLNLIK